MLMKKMLNHRPQTKPRHQEWVIRKQTVIDIPTKETNTQRNSLFISKMITVNSEIFERILLSRLALKHILSALQIRDKGVIYLYQ